MTQLALSNLVKPEIKFSKNVLEKISVLALNGPPRSGKDSLANIFENKLSLREDTTIFRMSIAHELKSMVHLVLGIEDVPPNYFDNVKDEPRIEFAGRHPRECYIKMSEAFIKPLFGQDFWISRAFTSKFFTQFAEESNADRIVVIITDLGFIEELEYLGSLFGWSNVLQIKVERVGYDFANDSRSYVKKDWANHPHLTVHNYVLEEAAARALPVIEDFLDAVYSK